jgi:hypothetical protein
MIENKATRTHGLMDGNGLFFGWIQTKTECLVHVFLSPFLFLRLIIHPKTKKGNIPNQFLSANAEPTFTTHLASLK